MGFTKSKPRILTYQDYKMFTNNAFRSEIQSLCSSKAHLRILKDFFFTFSINMQKKCLRANETAFMTKELDVCIMKSQDSGLSF